MLADRDLTLHNLLGLCKPACASLHSKRERTSSIQLRLRSPGQLRIVRIHVEHVIQGRMQDCGTGGGATK